MEKTYYIGLDVGSTTAKIAVIDSDNRVIYSKYERHNARVNELVSQYFDEILALTGDAEARICVTGSVGMATAEQLQAEFVQEVVAASVYARTAHPEAKALIDIGGEDAKVIFFKENGNMELRMNGNCAGGTGAFIDQMSVLMGVENQKMSELAMKAEHGVQTVVTLSHGISFEAPILLCGGPLTFLPALRKAFCDYLHLSPNDFIVSGNSNLIPALGCAYRAKSADSAASVSVLRSRMKKEIQTEWTSSLLPLFKNEKEHQEWLKSKAKFATETKPLNKGKQQVVIGIDSGSTTTKIVAVRVNAETPTGDIVFTNYRLNLGNPRFLLYRLRRRTYQGGFRPRQRHYRNNGARKSSCLTHARREFYPGHRRTGHEGYLRGERGCGAHGTQRGVQFGLRNIHPDLCQQHGLFCRRFCSTRLPVEGSLRPGNPLHRLHELEGEAGAQRGRICS